MEQMTCKWRVTSLLFSFSGIFIQLHFLFQKIKIFITVQLDPYISITFTYQLNVKDNFKSTNIEPITNVMLNCT